MRALPLILMLGLTACGGMGTSTDTQTWAAQTQSDYSDALRNWTRKGQAFQDLEQRILVYATLLSPSFQADRARFEGKNLGLSQADIEARVEQATAEAEDSVQFFMVVSTFDSHWNNLDKAEHTFSLFLKSATGESTPTSVKLLNKEEYTNAQLAFSYAEPLFKGYLVRFPKPESTGTSPGDLTLRIAGAPALVELKWDLK